MSGSSFGKAFNNRVPKDQSKISGLGSSCIAPDIGFSGSLEFPQTRNDGGGGRPPSKGPRIDSVFLFNAEVSQTIVLRVDLVPRTWWNLEQTHLNQHS